MSEVGKQKCGVEVSLKSQKVVSPCFQPPKTKPLPEESHFKPGEFADKSERH